MNAVVNGIRLAYRDSGQQQARTLLLIHGFPLDHRLWDEQVTGLADQVRVIAPDLRGAGDSATPPGPYSVDQYAADLAGLLDYLRLDQAVIGGLSMGGYIAFAFWRLFPERVQALVLCDTRAEPDSEQGKANRNAAIAQIRAGAVEPFARDQMQHLLGPASLADTRLAGRAFAMMAAQPAAGIVAALQALRDRPDSRPALPGITAPVLVLVGAEDSVTTPANARDMATAIPNARLIEIPDSGHLSSMEQPEAVNQAIRDFLAGL
ncbi:MAG TPA: alpha/beta hydrolase [Anaerolineae bacterium]